jgi:hypothetical protein
MSKPQRLMAIHGVNIMTETVTRIDFAHKASARAAYARTLSRLTETFQYRRASLITRQRFIDNRPRRMA